MSHFLVQGHVLDILRDWPDEEFNCVVTSPPYWGLRDYKTGPQVWGVEPQCKHNWGAESFPDKRGLQIGKAVSPDMRGVSRGSFCAVCGAWRGHLGGELTPEMYVGHLVEVFRELRRVLRKDGTLWLNLGDSYTTGAFTRQGNLRNVPQVPNDWAGTELGGRKRAAHANPDIRRFYELKPKDLCMIPARVALALQADGWYLRSDIIWAKPNPMPESVRDRPTKSHEYIFLLTKSEKYWYDADAIAEQAICDRKRGTHDYSHVPGGGDNSGLSHGEFITRNKRDVWTIPTRPFKGAHFATFPPALVEICLKAGCPPGGIVLDPFIGSGSTLMVAERLGMNGVGIDLSADYIAMSERRVKEGK